MELEQGPGITLSAQVTRISTTVDGGWSITLACGQDEVKKLAILSSLRDRPMEVAFLPHPDDSDGPYIGLAGGLE